MAFLGKSRNRRRGRTAGGRCTTTSNATTSPSAIMWSNKTTMTLNRLGMLLSAHGFKKVVIGTKRLRGWIVYQRISDEIKTEQHFNARMANEQLNR